MAELPSPLGRGAGGEGDTRRRGERSNWREQTLNFLILERTNFKFSKIEASLSL